MPLFLLIPLNPFFFMVNLGENSITKFQVIRDHSVIHDFQVSHMKNVKLDLMILTLLLVLNIVIWFETTFLENSYFLPIIFRFEIKLIVTSFTISLQWSNVSNDFLESFLSCKLFNWHLYSSFPCKGGRLGW